jgi:hypothetical protein
MELDRAVPLGMTGAPTVVVANGREVRVVVERVFPFPAARQQDNPDRRNPGNRFYLRLQN